MAFHSTQCQPPGTRQPLSPPHKGRGAKSLFVLFPRGGQAMGENRELLSLGYIWSSWDWFCQENNHPFTGWKAPALQTHWLAGAVRRCWQFPSWNVHPRGPQKQTPPYLPTALLFPCWGETGVKELCIKIKEKKKPLNKVGLILFVLIHKSSK